MVIREPQISQDEEISLTQKYNPYFRYPVSDWRETGEVRDGELLTYGASSAVSKPRFELSDYHAQGAAFWLVVVGDAMTAPSGVSIAADMLILVDPAIVPEPGKLVIAQWPGSAEAVFRKLIEEGGQRYLVPLNPTYPKALYTEECRIIGVVVQATAKF
jgi:SOS-response transcriptional repressor LexA